MMLWSNIKKDRRLKQAKRRIRSIPDPVLNKICNDLQHQLGTDSGFVTFVGSGRAYVVGATDTMPSEFLQEDGVMLNASFCATLINSAHATDGIVANNTRSEPMLKYCPTTAIYGAWVGAPVHFKGDIVGAIGVATYLPHEWRKDALSLVKTAAQLVEAEIN